MIGRHDQIIRCSMIACTIITLIVAYFEFLYLVMVFTVIFLVLNYLDPGIKHYDWKKFNDDMN